jgi:hypothetical protein
MKCVRGRFSVMTQKTKLDEVAAKITKGVSVLLEMIRAGWTVIASRAYMRHILESLPRSPNMAVSGK